MQIYVYAPSKNVARKGLNQLRDYDMNRFMYDTGM